MTLPWTLQEIGVGVPFFLLGTLRYIEFIDLEYFLFLGYDLVSGRHRVTFLFNCAEVYVLLEHFRYSCRSIWLRLYDVFWIGAQLLLEVARVKSFKKNVFLCGWWWKFRLDQVGFLEKVLVWWGTDCFVLVVIDSYPLRRLTWIKWLRTHISIWLRNRCVRLIDEILHFFDLSLLFHRWLILLIDLVYGLNQIDIVVRVQRQRKHRCVTSLPAAAHTHQTASNR